MTYTASIDVRTDHVSDIVWKRKFSAVAVEEDVVPRTCPSTDREAILRDLYAERQGLKSSARQGQLTLAEGSYLEDIEREINRWEAVEIVPREANPLWQELEALAEGVVGLYKK